MSATDRSFTAPTSSIELGRNRFLSLGCQPQEMPPKLLSKVRHSRVRRNPVVLNNPGPVSHNLQKRVNAPCATYPDDDSSLLIRRPNLEVGALCDMIVQEVQQGI